MSGVVAYGIEAAVGVVCLVAAFGVRGQSGLRPIAVLLAIAGIAAVVHAAASVT